MGIGCTISSSNTTTYIVANYLPYGNVVGRFRENVPPPVTQTRLSCTCDHQGGARLDRLDFVKQALDPEDKIEVL